MACIFFLRERGRKEGRWIGENVPPHWRGGGGGDKGERPSMIMVVPTLKSRGSKVEDLIVFGALLSTGHISIGICCRRHHFISWPPSHPTACPDPLHVRQSVWSCLCVSAHYGAIKGETHNDHCCSHSEIMRKQGRRSHCFWRLTQTQLPAAPYPPISLVMCFSSDVHYGFM